MSDDLRELDAQVAERIMGWLPPSHADTVAMRGRQFMSHSTYDGLYLSPLGEIRRPPLYSADIAAAMEVIEHLRNSLQWCCVVLSDYNYAWKVSLSRAEPENAEHKVTVMEVDESLPVAICRAALKAVGAAVTTERE